MPAAYGNPRSIRRYKRKRYPDILFAAQQFFGVEKFKCKPKDRSYRTEGDVAFVPV